MALNFRRGSAAIEEAAARKNGGNFRPFLPEIFWKKAGETKYVLVLTDLQDVVSLLLHQFIPVGKGKKANGEEFTRYEEFLSRRDPALAEDHDDLEDRLDRDPKTRIIGVMAELDAIWEAGTKKLKGFTVKTETFTRNTDDGEVEVTAPVIGLCTQSAQLMWGPLNNYYNQLGDLAEIPVSITKQGEKTNTRYDMLPFLEKPVDVSPIIEYLEGISYIGDDLADLQLAVSAEENDLAAVRTIADFLLNKRINELADNVRYEELVGPLTLDDMPKNNWGRKQTDKTSQARPARPVRRSPREDTADEPVEEKPRNERFAALKNRVEARS